jgi:hypothetical protein
MQLHGWRRIRMQSAFVEREHSKFRVGEVGMPDLLFVRYAAGCDAQVLWVETKSSTGKRRAAQREWHEAEKQRGAWIVAAGDVSAFMIWYASVFGEERVPRRHEGWVFVEKTA